MLDTSHANQRAMTITEGGRKKSPVVRLICVANGEKTIIHLYEFWVIQEMEGRLGVPREGLLDRRRRGDRPDRTCLASTTTAFFGPFLRKAHVVCSELWICGSTCLPWPGLSLMYEMS